MRARQVMHRAKVLRALSLNVNSIVRSTHHNAERAYLGFAPWREEGQD